jgi:hypothetical protein
LDVNVIEQKMHGIHGIKIKCQLCDDFLANFDPLTCSYKLLILCAGLCISDTRINAILSAFYTNSALVHHSACRIKTRTEYLCSERKSADACRLLLDASCIGRAVSLYTGSCLLAQHVLGSEPYQPTSDLFVSPCRHGMARPQVADEESSCKYIKQAVPDSRQGVVIQLGFRRGANNFSP